MENEMKQILILMLMGTSVLFAFDMKQVTDSVDKTKALESIKTEKAIDTLSKGSDMKMKDVTDSVDGEKAMESVNTEKLMKSLF
jgi:hypothetical protein